MNCQRGESRGVSRGVSKVKSDSRQSTLSGLVSTVGPLLNVPGKISEKMSSKISVELFGVNSQLPTKCAREKGLQKGLVLKVCSLQGGEDPLDALTRRSFPQKSH